MTKIVVALSLACLATSAGLARADDFRLLGGDLKQKQFKFLNLTASLPPANGVGSAWLLVVYGDQNYGFKDVDYSYIQVELDCAGKRTRLKSATNHSVDGVTSPPLTFPNNPWDDVKPESPTLDAFRSVCLGEKVGFPVEEKSGDSIVNRLKRSLAAK